MTDLEQRFVQHFGEMGSRWGINRTVGQIYALLYLADRPLNADEIAERLGYVALVVVAIRVGWGFIAPGSAPG